MLYRRFIVFTILFFAVTHLMGQDIVNFTQFFFNPYKTNPSYAGIDGRACITLSYRKQWATIDGGPTISNLSFHAPASKRLSYGLNVMQDKRGLLSTSGFLLTLGYNIPVAEHSSVRFGISGGVSFNQLDMARLDGFSDKAIANILSSNTYVTGNAGLSFHSKTLHGGISLPLLLEPAYVSKDAFSITQVKPFQSLIVHLSNRFYFNSNKNVFEPYLLYRINQGLPSQLEAAAVVHMMHVVYVGASYKQDFGISALGGFKINNMLAIGASYGLKNTGMNELNSPTYEIHIGYLFGKHKKENMKYSFVDTHIEKEKKGRGKSASEQIAEKKKQEALNHKKKEQEALALQRVKEQEQKRQQSELQKKQHDEIANAEAIKKEPQKNIEKTALNQKSSPTVKEKEKTASNITPVEKSTEKESQPVVHKPRFEHVFIGFDTKVNTEHTPEDEQERISRLTVHAQNPIEEHNEESHPNADRHEFVTQGSHPKELAVADYVISGVFKAEEHAKHFSDGLKKAGFASGYGHLTEKAVWYVYVYQTNDISKAKAERDRVRKFKMLRDSWLLTVQQ